MTKLLIFIFVSISFISPAFSAKVEMKVAYFTPSDKVFRDIYSPGSIMGAGIGFILFGPLELYLEGNYFKANGRLTYTQEQTRLRIIPAGAGLRVNIKKGNIAAYIGGSVRYYQYEECNPIGTVNTSTVGIGGNVGGFIRIIKWLLLDLRVSCFYGKMKPAYFEFNVGGIELGGGIVFEF